MHFRNFIILILFSLSFTQVRYSFELDGSFEDNSSDGAFLIGYDKILWKQLNINSGIGFEYSITDSPENMRFDSIYSIVNYNVEDTWNLYSKLGLALCEDKTNILSDKIGVFLGFGVNYYLEDRFHLELGYHTSYIDGYEHSRIVYSIIKHFEFKDD
tara:strand:- start:27 stop:497 length:471 start_codon:yes stop_codon:yes gene_type:complete